MCSGVILEKVCEYLYYNQKHATSKDVSDLDIPPELCLELLIAADYLDGMRCEMRVRGDADQLQYEATDAVDDPSGCARKRINMRLNPIRVLSPANGRSRMQGFS